VTSLTAEAGRDIGVAEVLEVTERHVADVLGHGRFRRVDGVTGLIPVAAAS